MQLPESWSPETKAFFSGMVKPKILEAGIYLSSSGGYDAVLKRYQKELFGEQFTKEMFDLVLKEKPEIKKGLFLKTPLEQFKEEMSGIMDKRLLAEKMLKVTPMYYDKSKIWWLWDHEEYCWQRTDETEILNAVQEVAKINTVNSKEKTEMLEALRQVSRKNKPKDLNPEWVQFKNQLVNIKTGDQIIATPQFFATNPIPYSLHEEEFYLTPTMDKIFEEWVGKENVEQLYEIIAYCCIRDYPIHRIFCFTGSGMNGKSCFLNLLRKFIGSKNTCSTELDTLMNSRFEVARLHKKLVAQMGETDFGEMKKTSMLKKLSGGDLIGFEYKGKDPFEEINYAKLVIATNNLPATSDKTDGFYRRWMIIDFPNQFSEKKDILATIPEEEYRALATKVQLILPRLLKERTFTNEGEILDRKERYEQKSNFLEQFIKLFTKESFEGHITKADFKRKFNGWCKENRHREMSDTSLGTGMKKLGYLTKKKTMDFMVEGRTIRGWCWEGLEWKE